MSIDSLSLTRTIRREIIHPKGCGCTDCCICVSRPAYSVDECERTADSNVVVKVTEIVTYYE
jgi:hypothetical protein